MNDRHFEQKATMKRLVELGGSEGASRNTRNYLRKMRRIMSQCQGGKVTPVLIYNSAKMRGDGVCITTNNIATDTSQDRP